MTDREEIYKKAIDRYGIIAQLDQTVEEMAELTQAISKIKRLKQDPLIWIPKQNNIDFTETEQYMRLKKAVEELADVELMIGQSKYILLKMFELNKEYDEANNNINEKMKKKLDIK